MNDAPSIIAAHDVTTGKGRKATLTGLSFEITEASFTALVGPNGSGKTTLFETLLGLVPARRGTVTVLGGAPAAARSRMAYVPQSNRLLHDGQFAGREFVAAACDAHRWGLPWHWRERAQRVDWALAQVDAEALARRRLAHLSGGQRQRLLIAQALVNRPRLLLLDEPLSQLDPAAQEQIVSLVERLCRDHGITVLFSTHDVNALVGVADRVLYLAGGRGRIGAVNEVVTDNVLSQLYGLPMHVVSEHGRVFVIRENRLKGRASRNVNASAQRRSA